ncbi:hypothetical protein LTR66_001744 [Elasticomyces elasticus]|nr:hypothetical protein LTR66_001744 [Elasticomyces elasticus]
MSENIPESIPTSSDRRSHRPTKRRALTPTSIQSQQVEALFAKPDREIQLPTSSALTKHKTLAPPPEIVANVQGSSAGAGSGEFHVYKASRRREYERLRVMDEEVKREDADEEFKAKQEELRKKDEEKTSKNRARREKAKQRKQKGKGDKGEVEDGENGVPKPVKMQNATGAIIETGVAENVALNEGGAVQNGAEIRIVIHDDD